MKHSKANEFADATLRPAQTPDRPANQVLHQVEIPLNGRERLALKVVESHGRSVLEIERQKTDRAGLEWRAVSIAFRVSFARAPDICGAIGRLLEWTRRRDGLTP